MALRRAVIFGCGYLGSAIGARLIRAGIEVFGVTRGENESAMTRDPNLRMIYANLINTDWQVLMPDEVDAAVFCMGPSSRSIDGYREAFLIAQREVVRWSRLRDLKHYVFIGSTSVYGHSDGRWVVESDVVRNGLSAAGEVLLAAESLASEFAEDRPDCSAIILRLAGIYGPGRHWLVDQLRAGASSLPGFPQTWLNLIHRDDAAAAVESALRGSLEGRHVLNISDGNPERRGEIVRWLAGQLGVKEPSFRSEDSARSPHRQLRGVGLEGVPNRRISNQAALAELNWNPKHADFRSGYAAILGQ